MDAGLGVMIFMGLVLKIPVAGACWLIWHAVRAEPEPASSSEDDGGNKPHRHFRREPKRPNGPRGPRRGPHAPGALSLPCPEGEGNTRFARRPTPRTAAGFSGEHHR